MQEQAIIKGSSYEGDKVVLVDHKMCTGCSSCYNICPVQAISMDSDREGFLYPQIDNTKCINCGMCEKACPVIHKPDLFTVVGAYGAYAKNPDEQKSSSSGGIFAVLAREVLRKGGIVCGAAYQNHEDGLSVKHILVKDEKELDMLKGTKYVQSEIGNLYSQVKLLLQEKRLVLFSGTPCQIAGLKAFLNREYYNLICVDLICHGVPSPMVFRRYLKEISEDVVVKMSFRNKTEGISHSKLQYELANGKIITEDYAQSPYSKGFIQNLINRNSCFNCQFKGISRCSDFTIGDFWAVKEFNPEMASDQGTSAVIIRTEKGMQLWNEVQNQLVVEAATVEEIGTWNTCLTESVQYNPKRETFFQIWENMSIRDAVNQLAAPPVKRKKVVNVRTILHGIKNKLLSR